MQSESNRDRDAAEFAVNMEILSPLVHQSFISEQVDADGSPFARAQSSSESAKKQTSEARARESAKRAEENELLKTRLQTLQHTNLQLASRMARISMTHVIDPPKLGSLEFKQIHVWLKKYNEYELLGGFRQMNQFIEKSQLYILCVKSKRDPLSVAARESFTNEEIETLLRNHNVTLNFDQSVRRLKENVAFSIRGVNPTPEELSKFFEEFEDKQ